MGGTPGAREAARGCTLGKGSGRPWYCLQRCGLVYDPASAAPRLHMSSAAAGMPGAPRTITTRKTDVAAAARPSRQSN